MRHSIRGLIIKDRKILVVTGHNSDFYWTPGGGVEPGETPEQTLRREIHEELGVEVESFTPHSEYRYESKRIENYLIEIKGEITPGNEITGTAWFFTGSDITPSNGFRTTILPRLIKEDLID